MHFSRFHQKKRNKRTLNVRALCVAKPDANERRKFLRRPDTNLTQGKKTPSGELDICTLSLYSVTVTMKVKVMISTESKFLSIHRIKYDIVTMTFKVIQSQRSWCLIKESTHVHIYEILAIVCLYCNVSKIFDVCMLFCLRPLRAVGTHFGKLDGQRRKAYTLKLASSCYVTRNAPK